MTTDTDLVRALTDEIAQLRRELAETRRDVARLIAASTRQDRSHRNLQHSILETARRIDGRLNKLDVISLVTTQRVDGANTAITRLFADNLRQDRYLYHYLAWAEAMLLQLQTWIEPFVDNAFPKMDNMLIELSRIFPKGFAIVPNYRLAAKKMPRDG